MYEHIKMLFGERTGQAEGARGFDYIYNRSILVISFCVANYDQASVSHPASFDLIDLKSGIHLQPLIMPLPQDAKDTSRGTQELF